MYVFTPRLRPLTLFVMAYFLTGIIIAIVLKNHEFIFYELEMAIIIAIVVFMDRRVQFSPLALWGLVLWGFFHLCGGLLPIPASVTEPEGSQVLYNLRLAPWLPKYDQFVHAFGFAMSAIAAHESLEAHLERKLSVNFPIGATLVLIALGLGSLNEIIEFVAVLIMPETNVGGYFNTGWDMVSNGTGAVLSVLYLRFFRL